MLHCSVAEKRGACTTLRGWVFVVCWVCILGGALFAVCGEGLLEDKMVVVEALLVVNIAFGLKEQRVERLGVCWDRVAAVVRV